MSAVSHLVVRSGDLKQELVDFALQPRFEQEFKQARRERFGRFGRPAEPDWTNFLDWFALQQRLADGRTVVEHFVDEYPGLTERDRALLLGWRDVVEGIFEIKRRDGEALVVQNLIDGMTYRVRSNSGTAVLRQMPRGSFITSRIVPVADEWMLSGMTTVIPAESRSVAYSTANEFAMQHPELVFRNPEKLEQGWELQRQERRHFIDFFGADLVVSPGSEVRERMRAYGAFRMHQVLDDEGKSAVERAMDEFGAAPPPLDFPAPAQFRKAQTVGVIYDETEGLTFFANFGELEETFTDPALANQRRYRQAVLDNLTEPTISPLPLCRLAARDPERASQVFRAVLKRPDFSWDRDGEALLLHYKASYYEKPPLPGVAPVNTARARAEVDTPEPPRPHPRPDYRPQRRGKRRR